MFKKLAQILTLAVPLMLVACGSSSTTSGTATTTDGTTVAAATSYAGTYTGSVSGINAGTDATITISSSNAVTGTWTITNRGDDGQGSYVTTFSGSIDSNGVFKADGAFRGYRAMQFNGKIDLSTGILSGTWYEYDYPEKGGTFSLSLVGGSSTTTAGSGSCTGSYVGSVEAPGHDVRIANRNRQLIETGFTVTGDDAVDNANTGGGGVDGGMYLEGSFAWETDANCNVTKGTATLFGHQFSIDGKVNADKSFVLNYFGPIIGSVDANNQISGQLQEGGKTWVYGVLNGKFTANGKI